MSNIDSAAKECFSDNVRFADLCNAVLFKGDQVVKSDQLTEKDSTELLSVFGADSKQVHVQKWRDILKNIIVKANDTTCFVLIGVEAQANIHYAMPVRNMIYDALNYGYQVKEIAKKHQIEKDLKSRAEFLSGFTKADKLIPIITITVYLGSDEWDAPRCLTDMYEIPDDRLKPFLQNFNANLFVPSEFNDFNKFQTELKQIFEILSASGDKTKMNRVLSQDLKFQSMDNETVRLINDIAGTRFPLTEKGQVNNMICKAWEDQYQDGRRDGLSQGRLIEIFSSVQEGDYSISRGAQKAKMSIEHFEKAMTEAGYKIPINV